MWPSDQQRKLPVPTEFRSWLLVSLDQAVSTFMGCGQPRTDVSAALLDGMLTSNNGSQFTSCRCCFLHPAWYAITHPLADRSRSKQKNKATGINCICPALRCLCCTKLFQADPVATTLASCRLLPHLLVPSSRVRGSDGADPAPARM